MKRDREELGSVVVPRDDQVGPTDAPRSRRGSERCFGYWLQLAVVVASWLFLWWLHADNNGLWYQGDAPRHATNGLFWQDFLRDFTLDAKTYALRYYARYPAINPAAYPPFFYLLAAGAFGVLGPSPLVAKALVLIFALIAALYTFAWLHRWITPQLAWLAGVLLLTPGMLTWSHAVMLNVPAVALMTGSLYHARRWLENDPRRLGSLQLLLALGLAVLTVLTYYPGGVVLLILLVWMVGRVGWRGPWGWWTVMVTLAGVALLVPCILMAAKWVPTHVDWVSRALIEARQWSSWTFYIERFPKLFGPLVPMLAGFGLLLALRRRHWRQEAWWLTVWILLVYGCFSVLVAKEGRYILFLAPALIGLGAIAIVEVARWLAARVSRGGVEKLVAFGLGAVVMAWQLGSAWSRPVPVVDGFAAVASFLEEVAPAEPVLYDGYHSGVFTFRVRASDPNLERQVILGNKLLYTFALRSGWREKRFAATEEEVIQRLRYVGGCRWLAIEMGERSEVSSAMRLLRQVVQRPEFQRVRVFSVEGSKVDRVEVYRLQGVVEPASTVNLPLPLVSKDTAYEVEPIPSRR